MGIWLHLLMNFFTPILEKLTENSTSILLSLGIILLYPVCRLLIQRVISGKARREVIAHGRVLYMRKLGLTLLNVVSLIILGAIWEISFSGVSFYFASAFTVLGVALFATWSVLSNLTSSLILFFFFPFRIGQKVKINDGSDALQGLILDINLFYIKIETEDKEIVAFPNSLAIQKPILILP